MNALFRFLFSAAALKRRLRYLAFACLLPALAACAQGRNDTSGVTNFVNSIAKPIYKLAWPTATYRTFHLDEIDPTSGGCDVLLTLYGNSGFDDSNLWLQLVVEVRNWSVQDVHVKRHNAFLMAPFETIKYMGQFAAALAEEQAKEKAAAANTSTPQYTPPQPLPPAPVQAAGAACIVNPTEYKITFDYRWGASEWKRYTLDAAHNVTLSWNYEGTSRTSPQLTIRYDSSLTGTYTERVYDLQRTQVSLPVDCDSAANYHFGVEGPALTFYSISNPSR